MSSFRAPPAFGGPAARVPDRCRHGHRRLQTPVITADAAAAVVSSGAAAVPLSTTGPTSSGGVVRLGVEEARGRGAALPPLGGAAGTRPLTRCCWHVLLTHCRWRIALASLPLGEAVPIIFRFRYPCALLVTATRGARSLVCRQCTSVEDEVKDHCNLDVLNAAADQLKVDALGWRTMRFNSLHSTAFAIAASENNVKAMSRQQMA